MSYKTYKLFANCIIVNGYKRSMICDLQRNKYFLVPHSLINLFDKNHIIDKEYWNKIIEKNDLYIFDEYLEMLINNDLIYNCDNNDLKNLIPMSLEFDFPSVFSNIIIDYNHNSFHDTKRIIDNFLKPSNCRYVQLRIFYSPNIEFLIEIVKTLSLSFVRTLDIVLIWSDNYNTNDFKKIINFHTKIRSITFFNYKKNEIIKEEYDGFGVIIGLKQKLLLDISCGNFSKNYLNINIEHFSESQHHNTCLNRKISIDVNGNIKNCPSMPQSFGNIKDTTLEQALEHPDFKKYWNIIKDMIEVCKDCEFRHICTDCRAYTERTHFQEDIDLSKPLKCGYNPYTNEWAEWSTNPLKQKAIEYYGMQELVKKDV